MRMIRRLQAWLKRHPIRAFFAVGFSLAVAFTVCANAFVVLGVGERLYGDAEKMPDNDVGLVLGARSGTLYFQNRIEAAAELYKVGRVRHLLVSGDNHVRGYDEPSDMKRALMRRGIPESAITCDYAGFRTLDSVYRSRSVFGLSKVTIVSQDFHNRRAIAIARRHGIDAIGYNAADVPKEYAFATNLREVFARNLAVLDLYLLNRKPHFSGPPEPIQL